MNFIQNRFKIDEFHWKFDLLSTNFVQKSIYYRWILSRSRFNINYLCSNRYIRGDCCSEIHDTRKQIDFMWNSMKCRLFRQQWSWHEYFFLFRSMKFSEVNHESREMPPLENPLMWDTLFATKQVQTFPWDLSSDL